jgi:hypothetical protein
VFYGMAGGGVGNLETLNGLVRARGMLPGGNIRTSGKGTAGKSQECGKQPCCQMGMHLQRVWHRVKARRDVVYSWLNDCSFAYPSARGAVYGRGGVW